MLKDSRELASGAGSVSLGWYLNLSESQFLPLQHGAANPQLFLPTLRGRGISEVQMLHCSVLKCDTYRNHSGVLLELAF